MSRRFKLLFICTFFLFAAGTEFLLLIFKWAQIMKLNSIALFFFVLLLILSIFFLLNCYIMTRTTAKNCYCDVMQPWRLPSAGRSVWANFFLSLLCLFFHRMNIFNITRIANSHLFFGKHHDFGCTNGQSWSFCGVCDAFLLVWNFIIIHYVNNLTWIWCGFS